jgi:hypothetical protein
MSSDAADSTPTWYQAQQLLEPSVTVEDLPGEETHSEKAHD